MAYPSDIPDIPSTGWSHDQVAAYIKAIATELGVSPSSVFATVAARFDAFAPNLLNRGTPFGGITLNATPSVPGRTFIQPSTYANQVSDRVYGELFFLTETQFMYRVRAAVSTASGSTGSTVLLAVYRVNADQTVAKVADIGSYASDSTGNKVVTLGTPLELTPGTYMLGFICKQAVFTSTVWNSADVHHGFQWDDGVEFINNRKIARVVSEGTYTNPTEMPAAPVMTAKYNTIGGLLRDYTTITHIFDMWRFGP